LVHESGKWVMQFHVGDKRLTIGRVIYKVSKSCRNSDSNDWWQQT